MNNDATLLLAKAEARIRDLEALLHDILEELERDSVERDLVMNDIRAVLYEPGDPSATCIWESPLATRCPKHGLSLASCPTPGAADSVGAIFARTLQLSDGPHLLPSFYREASTRE